MATIAKLIENGVLERYVPRPLGRREFPDRALFVTPELKQWFEDTLPFLEPFYEDNLPPRMQVADRLRQFVTGKRMRAPRQFHKIRPVGEDAWEIKTADVRIFGWFYDPITFIACIANSMELTKTSDLYAGYAGHVRRVRDEMDLDEPKCMYGANEDDVLPD